MTTTTAELVAPWLEDAGDVDVIKLAAAAEKAQMDFLVRGGLAIINLEPGNGHRYLMILTHLHEPWLPGDLLVSLPEFHACALMDAKGLHVPHYVEEKMGLGAQHSAVIAAFTTLLGDLLARP